MEHTLALIQKSHEGDEEARAQLVEENTGLIWCVVKRFYGRGAEAEDLFQIGSIGLLKAIDNFDTTLNVKFSTYAVPMISGEIKRFLRDDGMLKVSRSLKELAYKAFACQEELQRKWGREPMLHELAECMGVEKEDLVMAMESNAEVEQNGLSERWAGDSTSGQAERAGIWRRPGTGTNFAQRTARAARKGGKKIDLSSIFCGQDSDRSWRTTGNFSGSGVKNGEKDIGRTQETTIKKQENCIFYKKDDILPAEREVCGLWKKQKEGSASYCWQF